MITRIHRYAERVIEAAWLAALAVAPLLFHSSAERVFELAKVALVRSLALVMLVAWVVAYLCRPGLPRGGSATIVAGLRERLRRSMRHNPLAPPALLLAAATALSTAGSVAPAASLFGSYERSQGLYTTLAYVTLFLLAAHVTRSREQIDRAITLLLLVSFPVAFYAIIQRYALDPLSPPAADTAARSTSTIGNALLLGGYLILGIPLTLTRLLEQSSQAVARLAGAPLRRVASGAAVGSAVLCALAWSLSFDLGPKPPVVPGATLTAELLRAAAASFNLALATSLLVLFAWAAAGFVLRQPGVFLLIGAYALLLATQVTALWFSGSRGPMAGLIGAGVFLAVLYSLLCGRRRRAVGVAGLALALLIGLGLLGSGILVSPTAAFNSGAQRLLRTFSLEGGTTAQVRATIWDGALRLALPHAPLWSPTTAYDRLNVVRPLVGYGPDALYGAFEQFYPPGLARIEVRTAKPDRAHNALLDALTQTGLLGAIAHLVLFGVICYVGTAQLGLVTTQRQRQIFLALWLAAGIAAALIAGLVAGWRFAPAAVPLGMLAGWLVYLLALAPSPDRIHTTTHVSGRGILQAALLSALVGHWIEQQAGFAATATNVSVWSIAALLVASGRLAGRTGQGDVEPKLDSDQLPVTPPVVYGLLTGLILSALAFDAIDASSVVLGSTRAIDSVRASLLFIQTADGPRMAPGIPALLGGTLALALVLGAAAIARALQRGRLGDWALSLGLLMLTALATASAWIVVQATMIPAISPDNVMARTAVFPAYVVVIFTISLIVAGALAMPAWADVRSGSPGDAQSLLRRYPATARIALAIPVLIAATSFSAWADVGPVSADALYRQAASAADDPARVSALYAAALRWQPAQDHVLAALGAAYLAEAQAVDQAAWRDMLFRRSEAALLRARALNPLDSDHTIELAQLQRTWAAHAASDQEQHWRQSLAYYEQAIRLSPNAAHRYDQYADALLDAAAVLDRRSNPALTADARAALERALALDPTYCLTYALRSRLADSWDRVAQDGIQAIALLPRCRIYRDPFERHARAIALQSLSTAGALANAHGESLAFTSLLERAAGDQRSLDLYLALAYYQLDRGDVPAALTTLEVDANGASGDQTAHQQVGELQRLLTRLHDAIRAVEAAPEDPARREQLAQLWLAQGQPRPALQEYQAALRQKPDDYHAQRQVALLLARMEMPVEARAAALRASALAPARDQSFWEQFLVALDTATSGRVTQVDRQIASLKQLIAFDDQVAHDALRGLRSIAEK